MNISRAGIVGTFLIAVATCIAGAADAPQAAVPVTMLVPGFVVRELPVGLTNLTSLEYGEDGRLWALGYDGRVHVLTDSDGDGIEETAKTWWQPKDAKAFRGPIGMRVTKDGVHVASKGKISLLKDTDQDGVADTEEIVTTGWKEAYVAVDATGMALDREGNVYFGLGCADFSNAYLLDKQGKAHYDINSHQGTIQRWNARTKERETLATGVRFAIGIAFNRFGDLFWTDQEGDTWTKGNHLDELNVLFPGKRHYGFPERHAEYLPNTDDEPPVVGFGPQHQSTCGLKFNEAKPGWKTFGPKGWENDALVAGESRGKLWRVPLSKVREGYVGRAVPIASLEMLTVDLAISPKGDLVVCCHSGPPDWGTGPTGMGRVFKISYVDETAPQPVVAWPARADEVRVAFDRAIDKSVEGRVTGLAVSCGEYVRAGDRYEVMRPPYVVVKGQMQTPHRELKIASATLSDDGRTLSLKLAEAMPWRGWYAVAVPGVKAPGVAGVGATVDVEFPMAGVEADLNVHNAGAPARPEGRTWLPTYGPETAVELARGTPAIEGLVERLGSKDLMANVALMGKLDLPGKRATVTVSAGRPFKVQAQAEGGVVDLKVDQRTGDLYVGKVEVATDGKLVPFVVDVDVTTREGEAGGTPTLQLTYTTDQSGTARPVPLERVLPVWAPTGRQAVVKEPTPPALVQGGDWEAGRALFFGEAKCSTCHTVRGEGGRVGPPLSNLVFVNPESVLQDIVEPSARINPDHVNYIVETTSGDQLSGLVRQEGEKVIVTEGAEKVTVIGKAEVKEIRPSRVSLMPEGYGKVLGEKGMRDVLTFLTVEKGKK
jgi:putative heme-binding domain-containing protein